MPDEEKLLGYLRRATAELQGLRQQVREGEAREREPIAIVGMACHYPGDVNSPRELWDLVASGGEGIGDFPTDRGWDLAALFDPARERPGTSYSSRGGFLYRAAEFDPAFFGISPREALAMDPQQRLLLETSWEAFESAGLDPAAVRGSRTGVFAGVMYHDYASRVLALPAGVEGYIGTGNSGSVVSGRVAYVFGLEGPAVTVDTACSSSLVALHLAVQALRNGECDLALAGGVTVMATPGTFAEFSRQRGLATDGRCKSFAAAADGTGWSEGVGMLLVERMSDARARGHQILAVVRGSAVNQDGASSGLTTPNGPSQERVIRQALANARLAPSDVDLVEAHGTGTTLGDPIEAQALLATYGQDRSAGEPLWLGSIKSNLGHTQAAAGAAGIIKVVMAMRHGLMPPTLHVDEPTPHVDWASGAVSLLTEARPWEANGHPRRAAVSSFGISGTNAHVVIEEPPVADAAEVASGRPLPVVPVLLSARTEAALAAQADRWAAALNGPDLTDVGWSSVSRSVFEHRAVLVAGAMVSGVASSRGPVAFLFSGQGAQRPGMGAELYAAYPVFAAAVDEACAELDSLLPQPLKAVLFDPDSELLHQTVYTQAGLFAFEVGLFRLYQSWGVSPDFVGGHSIGEVTAAHVAGVLSLPDACRLVAARGGLMQDLPAGGAMLAIAAPEADVRASLIDGADIAAVNGPAAVVVSGTEDAITELNAIWSGRDVRTKRLTVSHAFHSGLMEPMLDRFATVLSELDFRAPRIPVLSNVTGTLAELFTPEYWARHVRQAVRFADGITALHDAGVDTFIEIGPTATLTPMAAEVVDERSLLVAVQRRDRSEVQAAIEALAQLHVNGIHADWRALFDGSGAKFVELPTYPFQRERFWLESSGAPMDVSGVGLGAAAHPLLGAAVRLAGEDAVVLTGRLSLASTPWLADHVVAGTVLLPGTGLVELAMRAGDEVGCARLVELTLGAPLAVPPSGGVRVQVRVGGPDDDGLRPVTVHSQSEDDEDAGWTLNAEGVLSVADSTVAVPGEWPPAGAAEVDLDDWYARMAEAGLDYGPMFRGLQRVWTASGKVFAEVVLPESAAGDFALHPALFDAALHPIALLDLDGPNGPNRLSGSGPRVPFTFNGVQVHATGAGRLRVELARHADGSGVRLVAADESGAPVVSVDSLVLREIPTTDVAGADRWLFEVAWQPEPVRADATGTGWSVLGEPPGLPNLPAGEDGVVVVYTPVGVAPDVDDLPAAVTASVTDALDVVRSWLSGPASGRLLVVTSGAVVADPAETVLDLAGAAVWGLLRSAQSEHPDRIVLADLDVADDRAWQLVTGAVAAGLSQVAIRDGVVLSPRLVRAGAAVRSAPSIGSGTVLITGGTGALGAVVAEHVVRVWGAHDVVVASRRGPDAEGVDELLTRLAEAGADARVVACDVTDRETVNALVYRIRAARRLAAVVHVAGVLDDGVLTGLDGSRLARVLAPKVDAAWWLHEATAGLDLDAFVVFSSVAGVLGGAGQASYAAANSFLDALATHRKAQGLPATSLAWGLWDSGAGMAGGLAEADRARISRSGMGLIDVPTGLALLDAALCRDTAALVPVVFDVGTLRRSGFVPPMLRGLVGSPARRALAGAGWAGRLVGLDEPAARAVLEVLVRGQVAAVLGHATPDAVGGDKAFRELGFDSLTAVDLRNRVNAATGLRLSSTLVFDYPTPAVLAAHVYEQLAGQTAPVATVTAAVGVDEPIAIVGMACHYPGDVHSPQDLWGLVASGRDGIGEFPSDRGWDVGSLYDPDPDHPGTTYTTKGGFLYRAAEFDPAFFGISPREALAMDPQQRLLLETSWEALESAGLDPATIRGSRTGVFAGVMYHDYATMLVDSAEPVEGYIGTGNSASVLSGRIAYTFGLEGPAVTVDTACSSSLVALHLAAQALRNGECDLALAGGVTVMATPGTFIEFSRQRGLSPDGRCKSFAAAADGTGWSEGVGVLLVERVSDAQRRGHHILAVIKGSAVNQDGASNGLTAPNGPSQQRVIRQALANARLTAADVDLVEAHGTGTTLGDPIEAQALLATYGADHDPGQPLWLGSVKSNIGHTQAAAGAAGVIKTVMAMRHNLMPSTLHADEPSPHIDWTSGTVSLLTQPRDWPVNGHPRRAAVSSFGISGTNAHVIIEEPPASTPAIEQPTPALVPLVLSGRDEEALRDQAARLSTYLQESDREPAEIGAALATARTSFAHRAVVFGRDRAELAESLAALAHGEAAAGVVTGRADQLGAPVFLFPGQGSQWAGMAADLLDASPVFAAAIGECEAALAPHVSWSLTAVLRAGAGAPDLSAVDVVQPVLWAVMVSLAQLWRSFGVEPAAVLGQSQGEIAAACAAGGLSLSDGAFVVVTRSRMLIELSGQGGMASVALGREEATARLARWDGRLSVAVDGSPRSVVVSGEPDALDELIAMCEAEGVRAKRIDVDYASHSAQIEPLADRLREALRDLTPRTARTPLLSTVTGGEIPGTELDGDYWFRNLRETVGYQSAVRAALDLGHRHFVEVSPHPVLTSWLQETLDHADRTATVVATLRRHEPGWARLLTSLAEAHVRGVDVDWRAVYGDRPTAAFDLPTYAFQRQRYWPDTTAARATARDGGGDGGFWAAVEQSDPEALATALQVDGDEDRSALARALPVLSSWRRRHRDRSTVDSWRYRTVWRPRPTGAGSATTKTLQGIWLLVAPAAGDHTPLVDDIEAALTEAGADVRRLTATERAPLTEQIQAIDGEAAARPVGQSGITGILSALALDESPYDGRPEVPAGLAGTLALIQALGDAGVPAPLWCVTSGAAGTGRADPLTNPRQAMTWGLGRVTALEHPDRWGGLIDLPATLEPRIRARLVETLADGEEDQVAIRPSGAFDRRLVPAGRSGGGRPGWTPHGTVLVTGGLGSLGAHAARWLAGAGADHLVLSGRRGAATDGADELVEQLCALGATVTVVACDIADRHSVQRMLDGLTRDGIRVNAVVHAAGVAPAGPLLAAGPDDLAEAARVKVSGATNLDELLGAQLDAFVLYSSGAGVWGGGLQGAYAAANAYLDALAEARTADGRPVTAVAWGAWEGTGMAAQERAAQQMQRAGMRAMRPELAVTALARALTDGEPTLAVADIAWDRFLETFALARRRPLIDEVPEVRRILDRAGDDEPGPDASALRDRLAALAEPERARILLDLVRGRAALVLGHAGPDAIGADLAFRDIGFDSLSAVEMRNRLSEATGLRLPSTMVFDHPTPARLAAQLHAELFGAEGPLDAAPIAGAADEPIAIIAMSCRYPGGVDSPEALWRLVDGGRDAIAEFPTDRGWDLSTLFDPDPDHAGTSYAREGGFLADAAGFDATLFGISPREAMVTDPQQRVLLETCWEIFERAGIAPAALRGSSTGVFVGSNGQDYATLLMGAGVATEGYQATGNVAAVISGRLAYTFGLEGPAVTVDTACSSSLVAMHLAAQALRQGECDLAVAGGVTVMATPGPFLEFARQRGLAADGRCKSFAAAADGTGWGEGAGLVLLQRLSDARRDGHRILAVVRGSAVNQDGASNGLTAPNGPAQQRVIRRALATAGLTPADVDAVEAHGTGTRLGDPIEAQALLATYGQGRPDDRPLWLGSVKSNIGHTQAAAGISGVIKMVMALHHETLPATLHVDEPSPYVDWSSGAVSLLTEARPWPVNGHPRRAGVSAFGVSGTNVHVILEEAPTPATVPATPAPSGPEGAPTLPFPVSADTDAALRAQAARLADWLPGGDAPLAAVAAGLATGRSPLRSRAVVLAPAADELRSGLHALASGAAHPAVIRGVADTPGGLAMVFSGQGAQRAGMGRDLYATFPVFADALDEACQHLDALLPRPLRDVMFAEPDSEAAALLDQTFYTQAALFAVEVALYRLVEAWGIRPDAVAGHSVGEIAAAHVAGVLPLPEACRLVAARGALMQALPDGGAMLAVNATEAEIRDALPEAVDVAAVNGPAAVVISGPGGAIDALDSELSGRGVRTKRLRVSHAFHSALMEPMLADFAAVVEALEFRAPQIPIVSNLTGAVAEADEIGQPGYWVRHVREAVRFADSVTTLHARGIDMFLEIGPAAVLTALVPDALPAAAEVTAVPLCRPDRDETAGVLTAAATLHCDGRPIDWTRILPPTPGRVDLPTYAFQHQRFWPTLGARPAAGATGAPADDPFWRAVTAGDGADLGRVTGMDLDRPLRDLVPALAQWRRRHLDDAVQDGWRYQVTWSARTIAPGDPRGVWLLLVPAEATGAECAARTVAAALRGRGATVHTFAFDAAAATPELFAEHLAEYTTGTARVVSLFALDETADPAHPAVPAGLRANLALIQAICSRPDGPDPAGPRLWLLTRGGVGTRAGDPPASPVQATTWGLGLVAALEQSRTWGGLLDLPEALDADGVDQVLHALTNVDAEDQLAVRPGGILARRLTRRTAGPAGEPWRPRGTALITGGTGAIGRHTAAWLARAGATRLILVSRRGRQAPDAAAIETELRDLGVDVLIEACDLADRDAVAALVARLGEIGEINTVVHAAGVGRLSPITAVTPDELADVVAGKVAGARHLDELLDPAPLDAVVYFTSIAGVWGVGDHGAYAAGNAFLDAWAQRRRADGAPALSVAWGPWSGGGMVTADASAAMSRRGVSMLDPDRAVAVLRRALDMGDAALTVADVDWERFAPVYASARPRPLIADVPEVAALQAATAADDADQVAADLRKRLGELSDTDQGRLLVDLVRTAAAEVIGLDGTELLDADRQFREVGFDSLTAVELRARLATRTGLVLASPVVFDYPTPAALAGFLRTRILQDASEQELPTLAELDRLEGALSLLARDDIGRVRVTIRLQGLLERLAAAGTGTGAPGTTAAGDDVVDRLRDATNDELFDLIDNDLRLA